MARCPACDGSFADSTFCPRDGARLAIDLTTGDVLDDRYRLLREVGAGAMGVVYEAEHVHIHRRVAVKILRHELATNPDVIKRLEREAQLTSDLGHPNIVQCRDFGYARDGRVYMVMEWLDGETLEARLEREGVSVPTAVEIMIQTCSALAEAHGHDVIHRDLKPANIFLAVDRDGMLRVKVLDFGIAKLSEAQVALTATGVLIGTPNYMSPEQAIGDAVDGRADIYALGVILYEMLVGAVPFHGDSALSVLHQHSVRIPVLPSKSVPGRAIPSALETIVMKCLEKRPADRFASASELSVALEQLRADTDANSSASPAARMAVRPHTVEPEVPFVADEEPLVRSNRGRTLIATGIGVAALVGGLAIFASRTHGRESSLHNGDATMKSASTTTGASDSAMAATSDSGFVVANEPVLDAPLGDHVPGIAVTCTAKHFECKAELSTPPTAGTPFQLEVVLLARPHVEQATARDLIGRLEIKDKRTHTPVYEGSSPIDASGRWTLALHLDRAIAYHVHLDILDRGREIDSATIADLTVVPN